MELSYEINRIHEFRELAVKFFNVFCTKKVTHHTDRGEFYTSILRKYEEEEINEIDKFGFKYDKTHLIMF